MAKFTHNPSRSFENWFNFQSSHIFVLISLLYICILFLNRAFILADIAVFELLQERNQLSLFNFFYGGQYFITPIWLIWKFSVTALILWMGCFMFGYKVTYQALWKWVMCCEIIFIIPELIKFLWFFLIPGDPNYNDILAFYPLSLLSWFNYEHIPEQLHYPLKSMNVFELGYWILLVMGIFFLSGKQQKISIYIVLSSYLLFFLFWLIFYGLVFR